jgi:biotin synthase-related radical SAM superfamily protein
MEAGLKEIAAKKAKLLTSGAVKLSSKVRLPFAPSRSTAGPGAGTVGIVIAFGGHRVKKTITQDKGDFELVKTEKGYSLTYHDQPFLETVEVQPTLFHAPEQAFFNVETECIYDCKFCTSRKLEKKITKDLTPEKIVKMIIDSSERPDFKAVALTSAVVKSPEDTVEKMIYIVTKVRKALGQELPIGVEPYVDSLEQIDRLKRAGADEFKLNVETFDHAIFRKVCGELDLEWIMKALAHAVKVFGKGKVCSNIIIGMGESDENALAGVKALAAIGVVATLRPLRVNDINRSSLEAVLGKIEPIAEERLTRLATQQKRILEEHRLTTMTFQTMCHSCGCCDIVPFRDI